MKFFALIAMIPVTSAAVGQLSPAPEAAVEPPRAHNRNRAPARDPDFDYEHEHEHESGQELPQAAPGVMVWFRWLQRRQKHFSSTQLTTC